MRWSFLLLGVTTVAGLACSGSGANTAGPAPDSASGGSGASEGGSSSSARDGAGGTALGGSQQSGALGGNQASGGLSSSSTNRSSGTSACVPNGYARNPIVSHIFTADPSAKVFNGRIYVYNSHDLDDQSNYEMRDYHVFSSDDLVNWQDHGVALDVADVPWAEFLFAPDACFGKSTGKYYLYFPNSGNSIGVAVSDQPSGPFVDALGKALITRDTPGVGDVDWVFDPACFVDDDGQAYLYFGGGMPDTGDNARVIRLNSDMISLADDGATTIVAPDFFEAPFMHKRNGKYYFSYSTSFANHPAQLDYMMSDNPMTGFEYTGTLLPNPDEDNRDNNHGSVVEYEGEWYLFYHTRILSNRLGLTNYQRSITLDNLSYDSDGKIPQLSGTMGRVAQLKCVDAFTKIEAESMAAQNGIEIESATDGDKPLGVDITDIHGQDWIGYSQVNFGAGANRFFAHVASGSSAGAGIEIRIDGCKGFTESEGQVVGSCHIGDTGGWQTWKDVNCSINAVNGVHDLCLVFIGTGKDKLFNLDYFKFQ